MRIAMLALLLAGCQNLDVSRTLGARCDKTAECNERCLVPSGDWPGGFCTVTCDSAANCPTDSTCIDEQGGVCAFSCVGDADCAFLGTGYTCKSVDSHGAGAKVMVCRGG
ncbi:MAG: hypothetical protein JO257_12770 [Deltaproteobacteria bacterium]|nr:hypothetical protein [Deltaproteobacteria bacterium]